MDHNTVTQLVVDLLWVLAAGVAAGLVCKRIGVSLLIGYLVAGAVIGNGGLGLVSSEHHGMHYLTETGVLLLLFSIGLELSLEELLRLGVRLVTGGVLQMALVAVPVYVCARAFGLPWNAALLIAVCVSFSSTVLVFKALSEWGQTCTAHGNRAIGILLFQDLILVPFILILPLLTNVGEPPTVWKFALLLMKSCLLVGAIYVLRNAIVWWFAPMLGGSRSVELVVLFTLTVFIAAGVGAYSIGLPPMLGALGAGLALGANRMTRQVDALILPFRETFSAVFFVGLGTLMRFEFVTGSIAGFASVAGLIAAVLVLKSAAAAVALKLTSLDWRTALGMSIGLSQMGEFSFVLLANGDKLGILASDTYSALLVVGLGTLLFTPQLLKRGLRFAESAMILEEPVPNTGTPSERPIRHAVVVGLGPIGAQAVSRLELAGIDVHLIDFNPLNLQSFAQLGFPTVAGDATEPETLLRAHVDECRIAVVTVPSDMTAGDIVSTIRRLNPTCRIIVRCRYKANVKGIKRSGANVVLSEEEEASQAMGRLLEEYSFESD